jgi:hypothetical protein
MNRTTTIAPVRKSVRVSAAPAHAFEVFTARFGRWWPPPHRIILGRQLNSEFEYDPSVITEVEVRFVADGANVTLVELEHRYLERLGEKGHDLRKGIDSPEGWGKLLQHYAAAVQVQTESRTNRSAGAVT